MKLVHISDTHLGWRQLHYLDPVTGRNQRELDNYNAFREAIEKTIELAPAALVHAGDLFDSYHPSSAALGVCLDAVEMLRDAEIPFVVIAGNHSTPRAASADHIFRVLDRFGGIHAVFEEPRTLRFGELAIHAIPHHNNSDTMAGWLREARPATDSQHTVLVAHVGLNDIGQAVGGEAGSVTLSGETLQGAGGFSYIALGHLHEHAGARNNAAYAGSLERLSWGDSARDKGIVEVDLDADRNSHEYLRLHPVKVRRQETLPDIDARKSEDVTAALTAAAESDGLDGAVVRVLLHNITPAQWGAVDMVAVKAAFERCLHVEVLPQLTSGSEIGTAAPQDLRAFLSERTPKGTDTEDFIGRVEAYLAQAEQELIG